MVIVFDNSSEQIVAQLKGHSKKITQTIYHPDEVLLLLLYIQGWTCPLIWPFFRIRTKNAQINGPVHPLSLINNLKLFIIM